MIRGIALMLVLGVSVAGSAQVRGRGEQFTRLEPGMTISVKMADPIGGGRADYRVYSGVVEREVRGGNGRLAIPRGSTAEIIVRPQRDGDQVVDLESVMVNGQRYAVESAAVEVDTNPGLNGSVVGRVRGGAWRGRNVRIPRGTLVGFRLERALVMGVADRGVTRDGIHYHDYYKRP
jgi:hypothetical protein